MSDLIFHAGAECYDLYGTLSKRTSLEEDVAETFTRTGTAYYIDRNGVLRIAEANVLRTEWTGSAFDVPTLLLEGARTNGFTRSEELNDGVWVMVNASVSTNAATAPDGITTADKLVEDSTASDQHTYVRNTPTLANDTDTAFSFFVKAAGRSEVQALIRGKDGVDRTAWFDLSAGTVGTTSNATARITALAGGWYRCEIVADSNNGGGTPRIQIRMGSGSETHIYNGDGASGIYLWGQDIEVDKPFASSYIKTVAGTVTRNAETLSFPFAAPPQEMTVYLKFIESGTILAGKKLFHIGSATGSTDPRLDVQVSGGAKYQFIWDDGTLDQNAVLAVAPSIGDGVEIRCTLSAVGAMVIGQSVNSGTETTAAAAGGTLTPMFADQLFYPNSGGTANEGFIAIESIKIARGTKTFAEMRQLGV